MMWSVPERQPELAGEYWRATGVTRLESRLWGFGLCGGGCIDPRGLSGTRHYYTMPNGKVKRPRTIFFVFFVGRSDGLWRTAFGLRGSAAKKSPRHRQTFAMTPIAGGSCAEFAVD